MNALRDRAAAKMKEEGEEGNGRTENVSSGGVEKYKSVFPCFCCKAIKLKLFIMENYGCQFADCAAQKKGSCC